MISLAVGSGLKVLRRGVSYRIRNSWGGGGVDCKVLEDHNLVAEETCAPK